MRRKEKRNQRAIINTILVVMILGIMTWIGIEEYKEKNTGKETQIPNYKTQNVGTNEAIEKTTKTEKENQKKEEEKVYPKEEIEAEYKGYQVAAKLVIPTIELDTYVLQKYSIAALNVSVTKFWGASANRQGNFCIAGHNFKNRNMFYHLKELKTGDRLFIIDHEIGKIEYEIYDIYQVVPEDVSCLSQQTNGKREVTLITCTNDSEKRIIVKAREVS